MSLGILATHFLLFRLFFAYIYIGPEAKAILKRWNSTKYTQFNNHRMSYEYPKLLPRTGRLCC